MLDTERESKSVVDCYSTATQALNVWERIRSASKQDVSNARCRLIRVLVVADVPFYREGLQELLARSGSIEVVGAVSGAEQVESAARLAAPHVVLLDIGAMEVDVVLDRLLRMPNAPKIVALAVAETPQDVTRWVEAGVAGYVPRTATSHELIRALNDVVRNEVRCPPQIAATLMRRLAALAASAQSAATPLQALTGREQEVLALLADGLPNKVIAARLRIQPATAKNHVHNILHKLDLSGRVEAASVLNRERSRQTRPANTLV
jgi:two-component system nitrate/nitrite response regulator NarL